MIKRLKELKKKNNKAFTLVELLATIALLGILMLIATASINSVRKKVLEKEYQALVNSLYAAGKKYYNATGGTDIYVVDLVNGSYFEPTDNDVVRDPVNNMDISNLYLKLDEKKKILYYLNGCSNKDYEYKHDIVGNYDTCLYTDNVKIIAKGKISGKIISDDTWVNESLSLSLSKGFNDANGFLDYKYFWYVASNSYDTISKLSTYDVTVGDGDTKKETYSLTVTNSDGKMISSPSFNVKIDKISPIISVNDQGFNIYKFTYIDYDSGINETTKKIQKKNTDGSYDDIEDNAYVENDEKIYFLQEGTYRAVVNDNAGNIGYSEVISIKANECTVKYYINGEYSNRLSSLNATVGKSFEIDIDSDWVTNLLKPEYKKFSKWTYIYLDDSEGKKSDTFCNETINCSHDINTTMCPDNGGELILNLETQEYIYNVNYDINNPNKSSECWFNTYYDKPGKIDSTDETKKSVKDIFNKNPRYKIITPSVHPQYTKFFGICIDDDYNFSGWKSNSGEVFFGDEYISKYNFSIVNPDDSELNLNLTAQWTKNDTYNVKLVANEKGYFGYEDIKELTIIKIKNQDVDLSLYQPTPNSEEYYFSGWCSTKNCQKEGVAILRKYDKDGNYNKNRDITLYAQWKAYKYSVTYEANGGTFNDSFCTDSRCVYENITGSHVISSITPNKSGARFSYWSTDSGLFGDKFNPGDVYTEGDSITLYAKYSSLSTITYDLNGGEGDDSTQSFSIGDRVTLHAAPTKTDYVFNGWRSSLSTYEAGSTHMFLFSKSLTAQWADSEVVVTYDANGGAFSDGTIEKKGQPVPGNEKTTIISDEPIYKAWEFNGWGKSTSCTWGKYDKNDKYNFTESLTLYACWDDTTPPNVYMEYNSGGQEYKTYLTEYSNTVSVCKSAGFDIFGWWGEDDASGFSEDKSSRDCYNNDTNERLKGTAANVQLVDHNRCEVKICDKKRNCSRKTTYINLNDC